jgi:hypothetical protein
MSVWDQSYDQGYPEQVASSAFQSGDYTETADLGPAQPVQGGDSSIKCHHGVLLLWLFALFMLFILGAVFKTHNLG